jgi:hypothetical protein
MPHPARHGGITSVHVGPVGDRYTISPNNAVMKAVGRNWKTAYVSAAVVRAWPQDISPSARGLASSVNSMATRAAQIARAKEGPTRRKLRALRERQGR